jgi:hypothetical protein
MSNDWFKPPAMDASKGPAARLENSACRKALTLKQIPPTSVTKLAGLGASHTAQLTFHILHEFADFPSVPSVMPETPDEIGKILTKFRKTRLYAAWLSLEADRPDVREGQRALLFKGLTWGASVLYDVPVGRAADPEDRAYIVCGRPDRELRIQPYTGWLYGIGWLDAPPELEPEDF